MKKIIIILILGITLIGIVGFISAVSLGIIEVDFTDKVLTISTKGVCDAENSLSATKLCDKDTSKTIDVSDSKLSILRDSKTGVIRVKNE